MHFKNVWIAFFLATLLAACDSVERHEEEMQAHANACVSVGANIEETKMCLSKRGLDLSPEHRNDPDVTYIKCGQLWTNLFVHSCGWLTVHTKDGKVSSWIAFATKEIDGP